MLHKIESLTKGKYNDVFSPGFLIWLFTLTFLILLITLGNRYYYFVLDSNSFSLPFFTAIESEGTKRGELISGISHLQIIPYLFWWCLGNTIIFYFVAPLLLLVGLKRRMDIERDDLNIKKYRFHESMIQTILGFYLCTYLFGFSFIGVYELLGVTNNFSEISIMELQRDSLNMEKYQMALEAQEYLILPKKFSGGEGSFIKSIDSAGNKIYLRPEDLKSYSSRIWGNYSFNYPNDTMLAMTVRADVPGREIYSENDKGDRVISEVTDTINYDFIKARFHR